jgi:hypothetical protein
VRLENIYLIQYENVILFLVESKYPCNIHSRSFQITWMLCLDIDFILYIELGMHISGNMFIHI